MTGVRVGEQKVQLPLAQLAFQGGLLGSQLAFEVRVSRGEFRQLDEVASTALQGVPGLDLFPILGCLPGLPACRPRVVPGTWLGQTSL